MFYFYVFVTYLCIFCFPFYYIIILYNIIELNKIAITVCENKKRNVAEYTSLELIKKLVYIFAR